MWFIFPIDMPEVMANKALAGLNSNYFNVKWCLKHGAYYASTFDIDGLNNLLSMLGLKAFNTVEEARADNERFPSIHSHR